MSLAPAGAGLAMTKAMAIVDGNEAAASVSYRLNEVSAIYPITSSSPMGELADQMMVEAARIYGAPFLKSWKCKVKGVLRERSTAPSRPALCAYSGSSRTE